MRAEHSHLRTIINQDGAAILNSENGTITVLNPTGALVWQALARDEDPVTIAQGLARESGGEVETLERDVQDFMQALRNQQLLTY